MIKYLFGLFLILLGLLLLLENLDYLHRSNWQVLQSFWPFLLIISGVFLVTRRHILGRLITFLIFVLAAAFSILISLFLG